MFKKRRPERTRHLNIHLGARMRLSRMLRGITREKLAQHLHTSVEQIERFEKGETPITPEELMRTASFLEIDPMSFYLPIPDDPLEAVGLPTSRLLGPEGLNFFNQYLALDVAQRADARRYVQLLTDQDE